MLPSGVAPRYDFVVCGSGSSGSVVAARLAENPEATVLLLEAGGCDDVPAVQDPLQWPLNLGSERDWSFVSEPSAHLNDRSVLLSMGKVLGGGSSINVMAWARGHQSDWDYYAAEAGDESWNYRSVLNVYRRIEDWKGPATRSAAVSVDRCLSRPHPTPTRPPCRWLKPRARSESRATTPTTVS